MARVSDCSLHITPQACIASASMLLFIPLPWAFAWIAAAIWHELFHCLALVLCRKHIQEIVIKANGAIIKTSMLSDMETLVCALAGPAGGLSLLLISGLFPRLGVCGFLQSAFNLLPVYPLDGGRALHGFSGLILSERGASTLCNSVEILLLVLIFLLGFFLTFFMKLGLIPVLLAVFFIVHTKKLKIPCK